MRYHFRRLLFVSCAIAAAALLIAFVAYFVQVQRQMIHDAYCTDWAEAALGQYLDDNNGRWPTDWEDLRPAFEKVTAKDKSFSFDEVRSRVDVNFRADPSDPNARFLSLKDGRELSWGSPLPNERVRQRLSKVRR